jgi:hypothetical protein
LPLLPLLASASSCGLRLAPPLHRTHMRPALRLPGQPIANALTRGMMLRRSACAS